MMTRVSLQPYHATHHVCCLIWRFLPRWFREQFCSVLHRDGGGRLSGSESVNPDLLERKRAARRKIARWVKWVGLSLMLGVIGVAITKRYRFKKRLEEQPDISTEESSEIANQLLTSEAESSDGATRATAARGMYSSSRPTFTDDDFRSLLRKLEDSNDGSWKQDCQNETNTFSVDVKCRDPRDGGPPIYLYTTIYQDCSPEQLRDFCMDMENRKDLDSTTYVSHERLELYQDTGVEVGRTVKQLDVVGLREYVLAWKLWEDKDKTFYCVTKACEHPRAPKQTRIKRVNYYWSGWRIRKVPGKNACEMKIWHQEEFSSAIPVFAAKKAVSRRLWSLAKNTEATLRKYISTGRRLKEGPNAITLAQKL